MTNFVSDEMVTLPCGSLIQHGSFNDRIYLMKLGGDATTQFPYKLIEMAKINGYKKIFAKVKESTAATFFSAGFSEEAAIPAFFSGVEKAIFMGYYLDKKRMDEPMLEKMDSILQVAQSKKVAKINLKLDNHFSFCQCAENDISAMVKIYKGVFPSYPFPIHDPDYLLSTMRKHVDYFGVKVEGRLVAISSAEADQDSANVEMTDFATIPEWRGNSFAQHLLARMEKEMRAQGYKTAYTIARAMSTGMNVTFSRAGYRFGGRLKNNTNISGNIESMNVWYKNWGHLEALSN